MSNKSYCLLLCLVLCLVPASDCIAEYQESGGILSMESENGTLGSRWTTGTDTGASNDTYLVIGPGYGHTGTSPECTIADCIVTYDFTIATSGNYRFWFRMFSNAGTADSFFWRIDSGSWNIENQRYFGWWPTDNAQVDTLSTGSHVLEISYREAGTQLDKFVIQLDSLAAPSGDGPEESLGDPVNNPPTVGAGADRTTTLPREYLTLTGSASDDGWGEPMDFLESTWSQISGPATVTFVTDVHQPEVTVRFPAAGVYVLQIDATDGLLNATPDTAIVTVSDSDCPVGDVDGDCKVTLSDLEEVALDWLDSSGTSIADLNGDAWVKFDDLILLAKSWQDDWNGSLQVTISPAGAVSDGAQWRVDSGLWNASGATVSPLTEGDHTVEYSVVGGWAAPANQSVTITRGQTTQVSGTYTDSTGSLQVTILPAEAVSGGAQWRVDGGAWNASGATVSSLSAGTHTVQFNAVQDWVTPSNQSVIITSQQTTQASGTYRSPSAQTIVISEFMAINSYIPYINSMDIYTNYPWTTTRIDGDGLRRGATHPDWIELHNNGDESIDLAGWYLTDNPDELTKWQFPSDAGALGPDEYMIVFASNKEQITFPTNYPFRDDYGALHTNFELGGNGGYLAVVASDGTTVSYAYNDYPKQFPWTSYGIGSDETIGYLTTPTPGTRVNDQWSGAANGAALPGMVDDTNFSHSRGFYETPFNVTISCGTIGAQIRYTTDGTEPDQSSALYTGPINISTTTCLRAKAYKTGLLPSNVDTQTYLFLDDVVTQTRPNDSRYATSWGGTPVDFDMENNSTDIKLVAGNAGYTVEQAKAVIKDALLDIPTLSVVSDPAGIFGSSEGIYTNTLEENPLWERPASAEYFNGDPNDTFQIDCGFKLQGGNSRKVTNDGKHSFSLRFRGGYGASQLKSDILDHQTSVGVFDALHLRACYNNSWTHNNTSQRAIGTMLRDQVARDCIVAMGQADGGSGTFVHLYIDGLYWGVFNMHERPEASHCANYRGGDSDWYDAVKGDLVKDGAADGTLDSWNNLKTLVYGASSSSQSDWEAICAKLDIENVIDWSIVQCWAWNHDMKSSSNWAAAGGGLFDSPWRYYLWDTERVFEEGTVGDPTNESIFATGGNFLTGALDNFAEFRIRFADRLYKYFYNDGVLTAASAQSIFNSRKTELEDAIIAESARWGDYRRDVYQSPYTSSPIELYTKNDHWNSSVSEIHDWMGQKASNAISFFRSKSLYPSIEPPTFTINSVSQQTGYHVSVPCTFDMSGSSSIYYTLDGTDPRQYWTGNAVGTLFDGTPITLDKSTMVKARVKSGSTWSALHEAAYVDERLAGSLRITEIMYHPTEPNTEFIELKNIGTGTVNLNLVQFTKGVDHIFGDVSVAPGGYVLLVQNQADFEAYYTSLPAGVSVIQWDQGLLDNNGDKIKFKDGLGQTIQLFKYKDGWYDLTDGLGFSLTVRDPLQNPLLWDEKEGWRASVYAGGTPGEEAEPFMAPGSIVINEVLAHSHDGPSDPTPDWIELYNTTGSAINISGWFLSDNNNDDPNLMKYEIQSTSIPAHGYAVFVEDVTFGDPLAPGCNTPFGLSEGGETVYLHSGDGLQVTGYYQTEENFDATETGVTIGRYEKAELSGGYDFTRMTTPTQGTANPPAPLVPDIVITEIYYNPPEGTAYEFVELYNRSGSPVTLMSDATKETAPGVFVTESIPWRLEGTGYEFPSNTTIPAGGRIIVAKDPGNYGGASSTVLGPYDGKLDNGGEQLEIQMPGDWEYGEPSRYWIPIEKIDYDDESPWPTTPDGDGDSLQRQNPATYGRDWSNWSAQTPTPGS